MKWTLGLILCVTLPPAGILWLAYLCIFAREEGNSLTHRHCCSGNHGAQKKKYWANRNRMFQRELRPKVGCQIE
jgi:hypothetical protein